MTTLEMALVLIPVALLAYSYGLYPAFLWGWSRVAPRPSTLSDPQWSPTVTVVLPAYNEERQIAGAIDALLAQDYPPSFVTSSSCPTRQRIGRTRS